ncbi:hypothetical protein Tco_0966945 [Tanacetum coccineum]
MDSDKYLEGKFMQRPPLFESDYFLYWKNRFETYVKAKDLDLWHIILNGDFLLLAKNEVTQILEVVPFEEQFDDLKKKLAKNNKAKMVLYNALPKKEYERIFTCKTAKDIWQSLLTTHQESKDLSSLALDELIGNLKVHEVVMEKDFEIYKGKKERVKSIALKAKKESCDDETSTFVSDDEEYAMVARVTGNALDAVIQIISLAIVQKKLATKIKRPLLEVLGAIAKMTPKTKLTMKLVSWLNRQMRYA